MTDILYDIPWERLTAMVGFFLAMFALAGVIGTRWTPFARWLGKGWRTFTGAEDATQETRELKVAIREYIDSHEVFNNRIQEVERIRNRQIDDKFLEIAKQLSELTQQVSRLVEENSRG